MYFLRDSKTFLDRETGCEFVSNGTPTYWPTDTDKISDAMDFFIARKVRFPAFHFQ